MKEDEKELIKFVELVDNKEIIAVVLESYIQKNGPVSNEAGDDIKRLLKLKK